MPCLRLVCMMEGTSKVFPSRRAQGLEVEVPRQGLVAGEDDPTVKAAGPGPVAHALGNEMGNGHGSPRGYRPGNGGGEAPREWTGRGAQPPRRVPESS